MSELGVGDSLKLADVTAPEGLSFTGDLDLVLATVTSSSPVDLPRTRPREARGASRARSPRRLRPSPRPSRPRVRSGDARRVVDILVAGLGNPGGRYRATRHNVGFLVAELLASRHGASPERTKHGGLLQEVRLPEGQTLALLRPQEYMNLSGGPVARAAQGLRRSGPSR